MINWFDMPAEGLSNGGLFEVKELEVTENGTYETKGEMYNKVTVNVEGGGGPSDFSTAVVTFINNTVAEEYINGAFIDNNMIRYMSEIGTGTSTKQVVVYKSGSLAYIDDEEATISVSGDATIEDGVIIITGDCTITIS